MEELGYRVEITRDPDRVLSLVKDSPQSFDVVVSDMTMSNISGVELAHKLQLANECISVVLMSGHVRSGFKKEALPENVREILQKPIDSMGLATALRRAIDQNNNARTDLDVN